MGVAAESRGEYADSIVAGVRSTIGAADDLAKILDD
jgi:hypothetical protein